MNMFNSVELRKPNRSTFDLSHDKRLSCQMGSLFPILYQECVPSDNFRGNVDMLVRLAPLIGPIYDQLQVFVHFFFVPYRLIWNEWEEFITGGQVGPNTPAALPPVVPQFNVGDVLSVDPTMFQKSKLPDYLGIPLLADLPDAPNPVDWSNVTLDCMPFGVCSKIWFDYYRDRNFVGDDIFAAHPLPFDSGVIAFAQTADFIAEHMSVRPRSYKHNYFTSALPWAQRGAEVMIPSVVNYLATSELFSTAGVPTGAGAMSSTGGGLLNASGATVGRLENLESVGPLVNDWRTGYSLQVWLERNAVGGSRLSESTEAHFGVKPQDARLQRAEYIGGGMLPIKIQEVVSTAWAVDADAAFVPQGNMAGRGVSFGNNGSFSWYCPEWGAIVGMMSIINPPSYHQGLPRYFRRRTFLDYPFPTFAKLGEQEVYNWEIYAASFNLTEPGDGETWPVFGYQSRYADWKYGRNTSHGDFHDTMLIWSLTSDYGITPVLSDDFTNFDVNIEDRIFAVPRVDNFWIYLHNRITVQRPLPYFGTPNNLGFQ